MATNGGSALGRWYRNRIGEPQTNDEVWGYWVFVLGALMGLVGLALFLTTTPDTTLRALGYAAGGGAVALMLFGPIVRLPVSQTANWLAGLGVVVCAGAILYFFTVYPAEWTRPNGNVGVIVTYAAGVVLMLIGGLFMPLIRTKSEQERDEALDRAAGLEADLEGTEADLDASRAREGDLERELEETEGSLASALADLEESDAALAAARATLAAQEDSQAAFELFTDTGGKWRWRLRHRNGRVIADGGQGYSSRQKATQGLQSVKRNALGAAVTTQEMETEAPEEPPEIITAESQATFEYYEDSGGQWRWRLRHDNGEIIADSGEGYHNRSNVRRAIRSVADQVPAAAALDIDPTAFEVYADAGGQWRWRLLHRNGNILADGGQGFASRSNASRAVETARERATEEDAFEVYEDNSGEHRWRLVANNGEIVADSGEGYASASGARDAVERVMEYAPDANALDVSVTVFELYEDKGGEWRWRLRHRNGNILADSGEGYTSRSDAREAIDRVKRHAPGAESEAA